MTPRRQRVAGLGLAAVAVLAALSLGPRVTPEVAVPWPTLPAPTLPSPHSGLAPSAVSSPERRPVPVSTALKRGLVLIRAKQRNDISAGTGLVVTPAGEVVTNYHVVRLSSSIMVEDATTGRQYTARLVGRDATADVALLALDDPGALTPVTLDADPLAVGDTVVAAGNAGGQGYVTAHVGKVVATGLTIHVKREDPSQGQRELTGVIQTDAYASPGDSGGPIFDAQGEVTAITTAGNSGKDGGASATFAIPIAAAMQVVDQIRRGEESGDVVIGPKPAVGVLAENDGASGVKVVGVLAGTPAERAGVAEGAHLLSLGDARISDLTSLVAALESHQPGDRVILRWRASDGALKEAEITLDPSPYN